MNPERGEQSSAGQVPRTERLIGQRRVDGRNTEARYSARRRRRGRTEDVAPGRGKAPRAQTTIFRPSTTQLAMSILDPAGASSLSNEVETELATSKLLQAQHAVSRQTSSPLSRRWHLENVTQHTQQATPASKRLHDRRQRSTSRSLAQCTLSGGCLSHINGRRFAWSRRQLRLNSALEGWRRVSIPY